MQLYVDANFYRKFLFIFVAIFLMLGVNKYILQHRTTALLVVNYFFTTWYIQVNLGSFSEDICVHLLFHRV